jgi:predicted ribosomally synthesized peptide with SipW-like signal peptide
MDGTQKRERRRLGAALMVFVLAVSALVIGMTDALFTDSQSVDGNTFTTGTVDIAATPSSAVLTASTMAPGDRVENSLTVANDGSLELRYAIQRSATNADLKALRDALGLRIAVQGGGACNFPYFTTAGVATSIGDDTEIYVNTGFPNAATNTVGDIAQGSQPGDRTLAAATNEVLCFSAVLPLAAGNSLQSASTTATFNFVAEQTANN